jgi:hypothetical protein
LRSGDINHTGTLLEPRHAGKLSKEQRKLLKTAAAGRSGSAATQQQLLPRRVRAMLTLEGPLLVGEPAAVERRPNAAADEEGGDKPEGAAAAAAAAAAVLDGDVACALPQSVLAEREREHRAAAMAAKAQAGDKRAAAAVGWDELSTDERGDLRGFLASAALMIGLHPDQATEPLVRWATSTRTSWAIIPCCVFAADAPERRLPQEPGGRLVASYEDFVEWLEALGNSAARGQSERVQRCFLPFIGKNQVLYQRFETPT